MPDAPTTMPSALSFDALLSSLAFAVLAEDEHRRVLFANRTLCGLFGIPAPPAALVGLDCAAMASDTAGHFAEPAAFLLSVDEALNARVPESRRRFRLADGRWVERDYVPVFDHDTYRGHLWLYREVTAHVQQELSIQASEANLRAIIENSRDPIWAVDRDLSLIHFNRAFVTLAQERGGQPPAIGASALGCLGGVDGASEERLYRAALTGSVVDVELRLGAMMLQMHLAPVRVDKAISGVTATARDLTRVRDSEKALRRAKELAESANRAKSDFLAHISHEIRTPLNAVMGMVDLALDTTLDQRQRSYLVAAQSNSEALLALISDILDFSKIEAGQMDLESAPFSPRDVVEEVVGFLALQAAEKRLRLSFDATDVPRWVLGDAARYRQIAMNLIGNAIKYTQAGGVLVRMTGRTVVDGRVALELAVSDTGTGIAEEDLDRVFSRFFRSAHSERTSGTGLGLAITANLARLMGGTVEVESTLGKGSTFRAHLPVRPVEQESEAMLEGWALVAAPHAPDRDAWASILASSGLAVRAVGNGGELLQQLVNGGPGLAVVLVDEGLPGPSLGALLEVARGMGASNDARWVVVAEPGSTVPTLPEAQVVHRPLLLSPLRSLLRSGTDDARDLRRGARVLVAEDHADSRSMMVNLLRRVGLDAAAVSDGEQALAALLDERFDVALLDLDMPKSSGVEVTQALREAERDGRRVTPVVMVSGHATEAHRQRAREAGVNHFVAKPLNRRRLLEALDRCVDLHPRVLVADDAADGRRLLRSWLASAGAYVVEATNGEEALQAALEATPDVIVLDMQMPVLDGAGAVRRMRTHGELSDVPILALTGDTGPEARRRALAAGFSAYLAKPCTRDTLLKAVRDLLWHGTEVDAPRPVAKAPVDDLSSLVPAYLEERSRDVEALREALAGQDWDVIRRLGHRIKGTAEPYGFPEIGEVGRILEEAACVRDGGTAEAALRRMDLVLRASRTTSSGSTTL